VASWNKHHHLCCVFEIKMKLICRYVHVNRYVSRVPAIAGPFPMSMTAGFVGERISFSSSLLAQEQSSVVRDTRVHLIESSRRRRNPERGLSWSGERGLTLPPRFERRLDAAPHLLLKRSTSAPDLLQKKMMYIY